MVDWVVIIYDCFFVLRYVWLGIWSGYVTFCCIYDEGKSFVFLV